MVYALIKSYAHAEAMGIKPIDGIVGAVIVKKKMPPYVIVGLMQGHTFGRGASMSPKIKTYVAEISGNEYDTIVHAISPQVAKMLLKDYFRAGVRFKVFERKTSFRRV